MTPWQVAQYPIAACVTLIVISITVSFIKILFSKTQEQVDDDDDEDEDGEALVRGGEFFIKIDTEDAFKLTEDGEYPELFMRLNDTIKQVKKESDRNEI